MKLQNKPEAKSAVDTGVYAGIAVWAWNLIDEKLSWVQNGVGLDEATFIAGFTALAASAINYISRKTGVKITVRRNGAHPSAPEAADFQTPTNEGA